MKLTFGTKAETLSSLRGKLQRACVLPQISFSVKDWGTHSNRLKVVSERPAWLNKPVIVRSSGQAEDSQTNSLAGHYTSVGNVLGDEELEHAIIKVISSFNADNDDDQVFIQPMLKKVMVSGVAFTCDPSNSSYYNIVNYDVKTGETDKVTSGSTNELITFVHAKGSALPEKRWLRELLLLLQELEDIFCENSLDVEFAVDLDGQLILLQVRHLVNNENSGLNLEEQSRTLSEIENRFCSLAKPHPYLHGKQSIYGIMPDWNPAEIIGVRPRPLSLSLYKELITDGTWAYQRDNYGYRNLRSFPLLVSFAGLPYIDVRVSFNSFIPGDLDDELADRLVNHYMNQLLENPNNHDKVDFEVIYSCYTLDLPDRIAILMQFGFSEEECNQISQSLRDLTNNVIHGENGLWKKDIAKIEELKHRQETVKDSNLTTIEKIYWLTEDCKRYGTLPFAGLARAGFIAVQLLKSIVQVGVLSENEYECFMSSLNTVSSCMSHDFSELSREEFLDAYGHLRPGTYDILSPRYDESPEQYFDWEERDIKPESLSEKFSLCLDAMNKLEELLQLHKIEHGVLSLFDFIKGAIEGREYAKFVFTKSLSDVLSLIKELGKEYNYNAEDLSYTNISIIRQLYSSCDSVKETLEMSISHGKQSYRKTRSIRLPPLITCSEDIWSFELPKNEPNFITLKSAKGCIVNEYVGREQLLNKVLMIPSADPGYDWIFSQGIAGFITMYGGSNSHMAIRAAELGIPAVIGAGESLYQQWSVAELIEIDCANKQVRILR